VCFPHEECAPALLLHRATLTLLDLGETWQNSTKKERKDLVPQFLGVCDLHCDPIDARLPMSLEQAALFNQGKTIKLRAQGTCPNTEKGDKILQGRVKALEAS